VQGFFKILPVTGKMPFQKPAQTASPENWTNYFVTGMLSQGDTTGS